APASCGVDSPGQDTSATARAGSRTLAGGDTTLVFREPPPRTLRIARGRTPLDRAGAVHERRPHGGRSCGGVRLSFAHAPRLLGPPPHGRLGPSHRPRGLPPDGPAANRAAQFRAAAGRGPRGPGERVRAARRLRVGAVRSFGAPGQSPARVGPRRPAHWSGRTGGEPRERPDPE